jgi:predicted nucleic acid-binding Zn ribbon protein
MSFKDELQTKIINARDAAMQAPLQKFRCAWCGHPVPQGTTFCSPACLDANQQGCDEETLEPHQRQEHWEE